MSPTVVRVRCKGCADVSENLRKLIGVAVMAAIVVVGVVATSGDDSGFTRNAAFAKGGVVAKEAPPAKGGDCCDESLYRLGQIEDRLDELAASLEQINDARPIQLGLVDRIIAAVLLPYENRPNVSGLEVANGLRRSGLLIGLSMEMAKEVAIGLGIGFDQPDNRDGNGFWGTRPGNRAMIMPFLSQDGLVTGFQIRGEP